MPKPKVRKGMPSVALSRDEFSKRMRERFYDPSFAAVSPEIEKIIEVAWRNYSEHRKSPITRRAGRKISRSGICSFGRMARHAREPSYKRKSGKKIPSQNPESSSSTALRATIKLVREKCPRHFVLRKWLRGQSSTRKASRSTCSTLSKLAAEYGRVIYPCKACVSTAMPLCHWPCSCYPNHALGQVNDWMAEIYPRWVAAHGVMILCPVNWYQAPSSLKLMIDRLVCADGGNPDPTLTGGKDPQRAKQVELKGWHYPRHLAGRVFSVVVHGDAAGTETLRRILTDWLTDMGLVAAGTAALVDGYVGYYKPYATSHDDLDQDKRFQEETRNAARSLMNAVRLLRRGKLKQPDASLHEPQPK